MVQDPRTATHLEELACAQPHMLALLAERALNGLRPLVIPGRGGDRNRGTLTERDLVSELGTIFEQVTGRSRGVTANAHAVGDARYSGPFVRFVQIVTEVLGRRLSSRKVYRLHRILKDQEREARLTPSERRERVLEHLRTHGT